MKCEQCIKEGKESIVFVGGTMVTAMYCSPFYDKQGTYHNHDGNIRTTNYSCSNGHTWQDKYSGSCHCGWRSGIVK